MDNIDMASKRPLSVAAFHRATHPPTRLPYRVYTIGRAHDQPYHATRGTYHDDAMFTLFLSGKGTYIQSDREVQISEGMAGMVLPDDNVGLLLANPDDPYDHYFCRFNGAEALRTARRIVSERGGKSFFAWPSRAGAVELLQRMNDTGNPAQTLDIERTRPVDAMLAELLSLLDCPLEERGDELTAQNLQRYMLDHIAEPMDLQAVADHFSLSRCHVSRTARHLLGETLMEASVRMKIHWARILLRETPLPIAHVARRVGYEDAFYFSKVFRRRTGLSPRQWRDRIANS